MKTQNLNHTIASQLIDLKQKKGSLALEDLSEILANVANMLGEDTSAVDLFLRDEIAKIASHIETTKNEIIALGPEASSDKSTDTVTVQLDAVLRATETAASHIMDAADEIQSIIGAANVDKITKDKITKVTARIYEACNFQDLTGQRITKVMRALEFTESKIRRIVSLFASDGSVIPEEFKKATAEDRADQHLLNGPQLPGNAPSQADIDTLFANLK